MHVDATGLLLHQYSITRDYEVQDKEPLFIAIVATLVSVALLTFLLRVYTRGVVIRDLGVDDWLTLVPAACVVGVLTVFCLLMKLGIGKQPRAIISDASSQIGLCLWILDILAAVGIGFVKLSMAFSLLRIISKRYHRHAIRGLMVLITAITAEWIISILSRCTPISANWTPSQQETARCMPISMHRSFELVNNSLNLTTDILFTLLASIAFSKTPLSFNIRLSLTVVFCFASATIAAAIIRTYLLYTKSRNEDVRSYDSWLGLWSAVELTTGMSAICLYALGPLISPPQRFGQGILRIGHISHPQPTEQPSYDPNSSNQTVIYHPNTTYAPVMRFHDNVSNLDFDMETPATRSRTQTMRSRATRNTLSRPGSAWSQFSGFTYYTNPAESTIELNHHMPHVNANELESIVQSLGLSRLDGNEPNISLTARPVNGASLHGSSDGGDSVINKSSSKR